MNKHEIGNNVYCLTVDPECDLKAISADKGSVTDLCCTLFIHLLPFNSQFFGSWH